MCPSRFQTTDRNHQAKSSASTGGQAVLLDSSRHVVFSHWLDQELEKLEIQFRGFTTRDSLIKSLRR